MNNDRRKRLEKLKERIEEIKEDLAFILEEEQDSYNNMPEGIQDSERGQKSQSAIEALESSDTSLDEAIDYINESVE